jgi:hypothetical protein
MAEGDGAGQRQNVCQHLDAAGQCFSENLALRRDEFSLAHAVAQRPLHEKRRAGLGEEAEDLPLIHRLDGRVLIGVAGQHHAHRVRR